MTEVKSKTFPNGYKVVVSYDTDPQSPREWDNFGTVVIHNRSRYAFADETVDQHELRALADDKNCIVLPIYLYDHSGITINTTGFSCPWDSGLVGLIYCTKADAIREFGNKVCTAKVREKALKCLEGEIKELDQYIRGEVYGFQVFDPSGEVVESCWGYYGDVDYCLQEGESFVEHCTLGGLMLFVAITTYKGKPMTVRRVQAETPSAAVSQLREVLDIRNSSDTRRKASTKFRNGKLTFAEYINYPTEPLREIYFISEVPDDFDFYAYAEGLKRKWLELPESNMI